MTSTIANSGSWADAGCATLFAGLGRAPLAERCPVKAVCQPNARRAHYTLATMDQQRHAAAATRVLVALCALHERGGARVQIPVGAPR